MAKKYIQPTPFFENGNANTTYVSPNLSPLKIYSRKELLPNSVDYDGLVGYTYRTFVYKYDDYDPDKRPTTPEIENIGIPNSKSGTYIKYFSGLDDGGYIEGIEDIVVIEYVTARTQYNNSGEPLGTSIGAFAYIGVAVVKNRLPLKKWTITDVILRTFDLVPTRKIKYNNSALNSWTMPKFVLSGVTYSASGEVLRIEPNSTADKLNKILAPEFAFTKMHVREMLKQIGGFIHGEPRIVETGIFTATKTRYFKVDFDWYGGQKVSNIKNRKYVTATLRTDINEYCTALDSSVDNLINRMDWASGVIFEPYQDATVTVGKKGISLRTENVTARMTEDDGTVIPTTYPIDEIKQLIYYDNSDNEFDITANLFENSDYNNLSSFEGAYPFAKEYALKYTLGQPNIKGLFFKAPNAINNAINDYAIINILKSLGADTSKLSGENYPEMRFRISYIPRYSARVRTSKQTVLGGLPRTLAYNQGANEVESRYLGEHLKGTVARLGTVEKTYTYNLAFLSDVPKIGSKFDDNYYISSVLTEILPTYIKCTISLSKDFNRLSQYVGISTSKRMWEVSEKMSVNRDSLFSEYILISKNSTTNTGAMPSPTLFNFNTAQVLFNWNSQYGLVSTMALDRYSKSKNKINTTIAVPILATALGNSMIFSAQFPDNYSAGQKSVRKDGVYDGDTDISGYWADYVPFGDYYGRAYYLKPKLFSYKPTITANGNLAQSLPQIESTSINQNYAITDDNVDIVYRKDSKETPNMSFELCFVTDDSSIIIGSALAKNCCLVNVAPKGFSLYVFSGEINTIDGKLDLSNGTVSGSISDIGNNYITVPRVTGTYKAWALVTNKVTKTIEVEDENGQKTTQEIYEGGELLLGQNKQLNSDLTLYFHIVSDVYE